VVSEALIPLHAHTSYLLYTLNLNIPQPPIIPLKDPTSLYTTAYPQSGNWKVHVNAERLLVLATLFLMNLVREFGNPAEMGLIRRSMQALDAEICRSLAEIDALESPCPFSFHIKVALIRLHRYVSPAGAPDGSDCYVKVHGSKSTVTAHY
jgi:hypothetical protein